MHFTNLESHPQVQDLIFLIFCMILLCVGSHYHSNWGPYNNKIKQKIDGGINNGFQGLKKKLRFFSSTVNKIIHIQNPNPTNIWIICIQILAIIKHRIYGQYQKYLNMAICNSNISIDYEYIHLSQQQYPVKL